MPPIEPIRTERLILRELVESDWRAAFAIRSDLDVMRYMGMVPDTEEGTVEFVARCIASQADEPRSWLPLSITLQEDGRLIGGGGLTMVSAANREADVGYLLERESWGRGFGTEAVRAFVGLGFEHMKAHRVTANVAPENVASVRVLEKVGFQREGLARQQLWSGDRWVDCYLYAILEDEWRAQRE